MGLAYYPLDEPIIQKTPSGPPQPVPQVKTSFLDGENTECNYLVMGFVVGVLLLALSDATRR